MLGKDKDHEDQKHDDADGNHDDAASAGSGDGGQDGDRSSDKSNLTEINFTNKRGKALIVAIATGRNHALALDIQGNVFSWGNNKYGQLGCGELEEIPDIGKKDKNDRNKDSSKNDTSAIPRHKMRKIEFISKPKQVMGELMQHEICQIYAGLKHSFAVTRQGKIFCWGSNENNLLGLDFY